MRLISVAFAVALAASELVPFPMAWNDSTASFTSLAAFVPKPAGAHGFVRVRDGHFATDAGRIRFVGTNFAFGANTPARDDADVIAARLAKFGINAVRLHLFDFPVPRGILMGDQQTFAPDALDRFDYLVARLKAHGIYVFLSLHTDRPYPITPVSDGRLRPDHNGVDNFDREMIDSQKRFARQLLWHVNPYTGLRWVDDPVLACVEINNENALSLRWFDGSLDELPSRIGSGLRATWNQWLQRRYGTPERLAIAWGEESDGTFLIKRPSLSAGSVNSWTLEQTRGALGTLRATAGPEGATAIELQVQKLGTRDDHLRFVHRGLQVVADASYTLEFDVRSNAARRFGVAINQRSSGRQLYHEWLNAGPQWERKRIVFHPMASATDAELLFANLGSAVGVLAFANVSLRRGGAIGLRRGELAKNVDIVSRADFAQRTAKVQDDWLRFLGDVEAGYFAEVRDFLREIGLRAPIVGTQQNYSQYAAQARMDVGDMHVYWGRHARVDDTWWQMDNRPMVTDRDGAVLPLAAGRRLEGRPFIVSEWGVKSANTYATEADLMMFAFASLQDWDGVFIYNYSNVADPRADRFRGDLGFNGHWNRFVALVPAALMFLRGDVRAAQRSIQVSATPDRLTSFARRFGAAPSAYQLADLSPRYALRHRIAVIIGPDTPLPLLPTLPADRVTSDTDELSWDWRDGGLFRVSTARSHVLSGFVSQQPYRMGPMEIAFGRTLQTWATATLSQMENNGQHTRWLLTLTGRAQNAGMQFSPDDQRWTIGDGNLRIEAIAAQVRWPLAAGRIEAWSLDEKGEPREQVPVSLQGDVQHLDITPRFRSPWYRLEIRR